MPSGPKVMSPPSWLNWGQSTRISSRRLAGSTPTAGSPGSARATRPRRSGGRRRCRAAAWSGRSGARRGAPRCRCRTCPFGRSGGERRRRGSRARRRCRARDAERHEPAAHVEEQGLAAVGQVDGPEVAGLVDDVEAVRLTGRGDPLEGRDQPVRHDLDRDGGAKACDGREPRVVEGGKRWMGQRGRGYLRTKNRRARLKTTTGLRWPLSCSFVWMVRFTWGSSPDVCHGAASRGPVGGARAGTRRH